jgi:DNA-binding response OmpR family regulator
MQVLVVEDEYLIRFLICDLLEDAGFRCAEAGDAEAALALLDGGLCRPDILVTDFNLGPGMDGKALAREVLRRLPGLPVAYVTGNPECFEDRPLGVRERLVPKPFASADLVAALRGLHPTAAFLPGNPAMPRRDLALVDPA